MTIRVCRLLPPLALTVTVVVVIAIAGCSSKPPAPTALPSALSARPSVYYKDDGPPAALPADLDRIADAEPRDEPLHRFANRPYNVFGVNYTPMSLHAPLKQRGIASWYGKKFHGQKTAIGETYDMFAMSAAHPTAPLPSFARVTSTRSGKSVVVRINDRGPFHAGRIVDLSYAAAHRIGVAQAGSGEVEFELLVPPFFKSTSPVVTSTTEAPSRAATSNTPPQTSAFSDNSTVSAPIEEARFVRSSTLFFVQLGAFGNFGNAQAFQGRMANELGANPVVKQISGLLRVQLGPFASMSDAQSARANAERRMNVGNNSLPIITEHIKQ
jgi:rare lipoprotein A